MLEAFWVYIGAIISSLNPFTASSASQTLLLNQGRTGLWSATLSSTGGTIPLVSPWISYSVIALAVAVVLIALSVHRIRQVED